MPRRGIVLLSFLAIVFAGATIVCGGESIRLATYNVRNYLIVENRIVEGLWRPNYPKPESEKRALRQVIRSVNPDILALQEMGGEPFLRELQRDLEREGSSYPHSYVLNGPDEERRLAILSRLPFKEVRPHVNLDFPYFGARERIKRGLLEVVFENDGREWTLFVVHLKSRLTERPDDPQSEQRRTAEATAARNEILSRYDPTAGDLYIIAGDFNDTTDTAPLRRFYRRGDVTISEPLHAADSRGHTWTYRWERQNIYNRVDYILVSPAMKQFVVDGRAHVYDGPGTDEASDHRLVWADLRFGDN